MKARWRTAARGSWPLDPPGRTPTRAPVKVVNGLVSSLAFGAAFPEARDTFWDVDRLATAWRGDRRVFLLSASGLERSVIRRSAFRPRVPAPGRGRTAALLESAPDRDTIET